MIRVFKPTDRDFTSNGDAVIVPIKARVKNNMNGEFFIELTCESKFYKYLDQGNIIITPTPQGEQAFRIDNQLSRKGERITIKARHVFYDAEKLVVADSYAVDLNCEQALKHFNAATDSTSPFTMHSDITSLNSFRCVRKSLAEAIGTVIERWGGYLVRNNWDISVNKSVGRDYGVTIRYAKNLKELTASYDFSGVATKLLPVGKDGILLPELYVSSAKQYSIPYTKVVSIQQDINEDDYSTEEEYQAAVIADLRTQAQALVNKTCIPVITYTLKGNPEKVQDIGDVIEVIDERIGVNITTQVIGYEWDVITEQYASLTFGNFGNTLSGLMAKVNADTKGVVNEAVGEVKAEFKKSINNIYDLLQGSYVLYRGYDILLLDRIPAGTAQNVIKFSKDGISVSSNGINGDFNEVYNIATKKLSVPSISLNGKNLQNTLDDKISYDNLKAGNNITITRKGKILTINSTGDSGNNVYAGTETPSNSIGGEHDIYLKYSGEFKKYFLKEAKADPNLDAPQVTKIGNDELSATLGGVAVSGSTEDADKVKFYLEGLEVGETYTIDIDFQFTQAHFTPYGGTTSGDRIYIAHNDSIADYEYIQALVDDLEQHHYQFEFIAQETNIIIFSFWWITDGTRFSADLSSMKISGIFIEEIYGKIKNKWRKYKGGGNYEAGDHITITDGVISANYSPFTGATTQQAGAAGLVPPPTTSDVNKVLSGGGDWVKKGADVEANPTGAASETLTKLGIDGVIYGLQGGGGGSSVIPNPSGAPVASLTSIEIDGVIYGITSGIELKYFDYAIFQGNKIFNLNKTTNPDYQWTIDFQADGYYQNMAITGNYGAGVTFYNNMCYLGDSYTMSIAWADRHQAIINDANHMMLFDGEIKASYGYLSEAIDFIIGGRTTSVNYFRGKLFGFELYDKVNEKLLIQLKPAKLSIMGFALQEGLYDVINNIWYDGVTVGNL